MALLAKAGYVVTEHVLSCREWFKCEVSAKFSISPSCCFICLVGGAGQGSCVISLNNFIQTVDVQGMSCATRSTRGGGMTVRCWEASGTCNRNRFSLFLEIRSASHMTNTGHMAIHLLLHDWDSPLSAPHTCSAVNQNP